MYITLPYPYFLSLFKQSVQKIYCRNILFFRDHYVEGRMRGVAPSKKIAAVQQKNVDVWVLLCLRQEAKCIYGHVSCSSRIFKMIFQNCKLKCIGNQGFSINFTRKTKKNKQKSKFYFPYAITDVFWPVEAVWLFI